MNDKNISDSVEKRVRDVIVRTFHINVDDNQAREFKMGDRPEWDSLGHMQLVVELEKEFGLRFPSYLLADLASEKAIIKIVGKELSKK